MYVNIYTALVSSHGSSALEDRKASWGRMVEIISLGLQLPPFRRCLGWVPGEPNHLLRIYGPGALGYCHCL